MSRRAAYRTFALLGLLASTVLSGCQHGFVGKVNLAMSASPTPGVQNVFLAIKGVQLGGFGAPINLPYGSEELVDIESGLRTALLASESIPVADFKWVRIQIDPANSYVIAANGNRYPLDVASEYQSTADFIVGEGLTVSLLVDIELRDSLSSQTKDGMTVYTLNSRSRLVDLSAVGNIVGNLSPSFMIGNLTVSDPGCAPSIYVYQGAGAVPEGFFVHVKGGTPPFASGTFVLHVPPGLYRFTASLLPPGTYTAALTCSAVDVPGSKSLDFTPAQEAVVTVGGNTFLTF